jgi:hypothetical protein
MGNRTLHRTLVLAFAGALAMTALALPAAAQKNGDKKTERDEKVSRTKRRGIEG